MQRRRHSSHAFSMIELALVLAIVGLLVGGIVGGRAMLRNSELRSVSSDFGSYINALNLFYSEFNALPGDITNATSYWEAENVTATTCATTSSTGTKTCNGNGDRIIYGEGNFGTITQRYEIYRAWQHLANAGMIGGKYSGVTGSGSAIRHSVPGTNTPKTRLSNGGFDFFYLGYVSDPANAFVFTANYSNTLSFGRQTTNDISIFNVLLPEDAWSIDTKLDDGKPATGILLTPKNGAWGNSCVTSSDPTTAIYTTGTSPACSLIYITGY